MIFHWYGFIIGVGILFAVELVRRQARRFDYPVSELESSIVWMMIPALIGARVYHLLTDWQLYQNASITELIAIWNGGLGFYGALLGGLLGVLMYVFWSHRHHRLSTVSTTTALFLLTDLFSFGLPIGQAIGRFGNLINTELYGLPTNLPWALNLPEGRFHPLFAYEQICLVFLALTLFWIGFKKRLVIGKGQYFAIYLVGYGLIRFWLEYLRIQTARLSVPLDIFSIAQWVSIFLMMVGVLIFWVRRHALKKKGAVEWDLSLQ
ncbi:prolipoprotein diacylglyceryl transferase [Candidatus Woesebacteria bacterium]|nr:prolipoprotein diacylglyceryl transferase [Candidatus Woesebacteria bacterium]